MPTPANEPSPCRLHVELGAGFVVAVLDRFGAGGWNRWLRHMARGGFLPLGWDEKEPAPPVWYWIDLVDADLSGRDLDGILLDVVHVERTRFDGCSMVGARLGPCVGSSFRGADLRDADLSGADLTDCLFDGGTLLDGTEIEGASFEEGRPPRGLPDRLLRLCEAERRGDAPAGLEETPVPVTASLAAQEMTR